MYPIHLLFCLVIVPDTVLSLIETALASSQIEVRVRDILEKVKDTKRDGVSNCTGKLDFITSLAKLSKGEAKTMKKYLKKHLKDIEQGNSSVPVALSLLNALLEEDDEDASGGWCCLPTVAIIGGNFQLFAHCFRCQVQNQLGTCVDLRSCLDESCRGTVWECDKGSRQALSNSHHSLDKYGWNKVSHYS